MKEYASPFLIESSSVPFPIFSLRELTALSLSASIRSKANWWSKIDNEIILNKWREESNCSPDIFDFAINDAKWRLKNRQDVLFEDHTTVVEDAEVHGVHQSDNLISLDLLNNLEVELKIFQSDSSYIRDEHPGSNGQVIDLIHPSLFPFIFKTSRENDDFYDYENGDFTAWALTGSTYVPNDYGITDKLTRQEFETLKAEVESKNSPREIEALFHQLNLVNPSWNRYSMLRKFCSKKYQWLPTELDVGSQYGEGSFRSYINNLHPINDKNLFKAIETIGLRFIPLFERVLTDLKTPYRPVDMYVSFSSWEQDDGTIMMENPNATDKDLPPYVEPEIRQEVVSLRGSRLQVIVKMADIVLTPEKPEYPGGVWHVEGMENESILLAC